MDHFVNKGKVTLVLMTQSRNSEVFWVYDLQFALATGLCLSFPICKTTELCTTVSLEGSEDGFLILYWKVF